MIKIEQLRKEFSGGAVALDNIDLEIEDSSFVALLGPSGCGKSTTLNCMAGLLEPTSGKISFGEKDVTYLAPKDRNIGMVFQSYALYPHMKVIDNIAFSLKQQGVKKDERHLKAREIAKKLQIEALLERTPAQLSGGQQQRVSMARALIKNPQILLLDEPMSKLDARLKIEIREEIRRIQKETKITAILVTHDQEEAMVMSDRIVVMKDGIIQQLGTPKDIYNEPVNRYVANFIGESNIIQGVYIGRNRVKFLGAEFYVVGYEFDDMEPVDVVIRPEDWDVVPMSKAKVKGVVTSSIFKGVHFELLVDIEGVEYVVHTYEDIKEGEVVGLTIDPYEICLMKLDGSPKKLIPVEEIERRKDLSKEVD
jgi:ABC-type Fe3+/spermidine/putrescine transport system ATPase subunit